MRSKVQTAIQKAKKKFVQKQITHANGDGKKFWQVINDTFLNSPAPAIKEVYTDKDHKLVKGKEAADEINTYFCNVSRKLSEKFGPVNIPDQGTRKITYMERAPLDIPMVTEQIEKIDITKTSAIRDISSKLLKRCLLAVLSFFTRLLNHCLDTCIFPSLWKIAIVVPIGKRGH